MFVDHAFRICTLLVATLLAAPHAMAEPLGPTAPTDPQAAATAPGEITLTWQPAASLTGVTSYRVYHVDADGARALAVELGGQDLAWAETGIAPGATVSYLVTAVDIVGEGPATEVASATTWTVPDAPQGVAATSGPGAIGEASVSWQAPASDGGSAIVAFHVYRDGALVAVLDAATFSWTDTGLAPFHAYVYQVSATNAVGEGATSDEACGMPSPWTAELGCASVV